jgi:hypothetical protein
MQPSLPGSGLYPFSKRSSKPNWLLKNAHLLRCPHPSSLRRTGLYVSLLGISDALYLSVFEQPVSMEFFSPLPGLQFISPCSISCTSCRCRKGMDRCDLYWNDSWDARPGEGALTLGWSPGCRGGRVLQEKAGSG